MKDVFSDHDSALVGLYQSVLADAGIPCFIRGFHDGYAGIDGIVVQTLCVTDDADYGRAVELLRAMRTGDNVTQPEWTCPACGEKSPGAFYSCWKCGVDRPA